MVTQWLIRILVAVVFLVLGFGLIWLWIKRRDRKMNWRMRDGGYANDQWVSF